jgi:D-glycero-D-manno-heptose 1,7-bisphosphate phosphatase
MLVLLDRDGVINRDLPPHGVLSLDALEIYPSTGAAIHLLKEAGFSVAVVTNQSAIGKGLLSEEGLTEIHTALQARLYAQAGVTIDAFYFCPDHPDYPTNRRKPNDGMLREAMHDFHATPALTPFVGDDMRDMQAALSAGCPPYLVLTGKGNTTHAQLRELGTSVMVCTDLLDAVCCIVGTSHNK